MACLVMSDAGNNDWTTVLDSIGRAKSYTSPSGLTTSYTYSEANSTAIPGHYGTAVTVTTPRGSQHISMLNAYGAPLATKVQDPDGTVGPLSASVMSYVYNEAGLPTQQQETRAKPPVPPNSSCKTSWISLIRVDCC
ncbi:MAG: hypothetical protein NXI04_16065 [Planctomycetaceae bacterium]|nr:hypothetical protein [Planctomycetaceae bacterium]